MRIAAINMSGGVGKTTMATYLLLPRMKPGTRFFAVESINRSADDLGIANVEKLKGRDFGNLYEELMVEDDAVIDVGASNIETFFETAKRFTGGTQEIDAYVIPTPPDSKYITESIATAEKLIELGVPAKAIRFILNRVPVEQSDEVANIYAALFDYAQHKKTPTMVSERYTIVSDPLFEDLAEYGKSLEELLADQTDYKAMAKAEKDVEKRRAFTGMRRLIAQAAPLRQELDGVFKALFGK